MRRSNSIGGATRRARLQDRRALRWAPWAGLATVAMILGTCLPVPVATAGASAGASEAASNAIDRASTTAGTVWLCQPGSANDPCTASLDSTTVSANGSSVRATVLPNAASKFDCFYVYPTTSTQKADNANLKIQAGQIGAAVEQASRFSQVCKVWAPMYRQRTEASLAKGLGSDHAADQVAYQSLLAGWKDYLAHDNHGRPIIFIGHSQGAAMLVRLLHNFIDPSAKLRARMVSAIILGGNVQVPVGKDVGGSFAHIPTCTSAGQTHCVIAYSSFGAAPPADSLFGRPGHGVSLQSGQTTSAGQQVACVNPVNFSSAPGALLPYFLSATSPVTGEKVTTPWVSYPGLYTATCKRSGGATWLQIDAASVPGDPRPKVAATLGPTWGLHLDDVNLALGNLVLDVAVQEGAYR
jgi:hypothetical protein